MNKNELNRDVKRLLQYQIKHEQKLGDHNIKNEHFCHFQKEYKRLYYADSNFEYCNKQSILILLRLNLRYRFIPLHLFGINIELENL